MECKSNMAPLEGKEFVSAALSLATTLPRSPSATTMTALQFSPLASQLTSSARSLMLSRQQQAAAAREASPASIMREKFGEAKEKVSDLKAEFEDLVLSAVEAAVAELQCLIARIQSQPLFRIPLPSPPSSSPPTPLRAHLFAAVIPGDSVAELVLAQSVFSFLNIYNTLLIIRLILTWFPQPPAVIVNPLSTLCDPYLNLFRGIIPPLGGTLDFSPILAFLTLNVFTNAAAAIPADIPGQQNAAAALSSAQRREIMRQRRLQRQQK